MGAGGGQSPRSTGPGRKAVKTRRWTGEEREVPDAGRRGRHRTASPASAPPPPPTITIKVNSRKISGWSSTHIRDKCRLENENAVGQPLQPQTTYLSV